MKKDAPQTMFFANSQIQNSMNQIPYKNLSNNPFPENTILKEKNYVAGNVTFYVYDGRTLIEKKHYPSVNNRTAEYRILHDLQDEYPDFKVRSDTWNPIRYRVHEDNYTSISLPAKLVEV
jgi:hypothetical protein